MGFGRKLLGRAFFLSPICHSLIRVVRFVSWIPLGKHVCGLPFLSLPVLSLETKHVCCWWCQWPVVCGGGAVYLQMAGEKQHPSIDLPPNCCLGVYYPYEFGWKLPRVWKTNLNVDIWRKQWFVFSLPAELGSYPGPMLHQLDFTFS